MEDIFSQQFGENLKNVLAETRFKPAGEHDKNTVYRCIEEVVIAYPLSDPETIRNEVSRYTSYFEEMVEKLQNEALQLVPNLVIQQDMVEDVTGRLNTLLQKAISGHPDYADYMSKTPVLKPEDLEKALFVGISLWINSHESVAEGELPGQKLFWITSIQPFTYNGKGKDITRHDRLEKSSNIRLMMFGK